LGRAKNRGGAGFTPPRTAPPNEKEKKGELPKKELAKWNPCSSPDETREPRKLLEKR